MASTGVTNDAGLHHAVNYYLQNVVCKSFPASHSFLYLFLELYGSSTKIYLAFNAKCYTFKVKSTIYITIYNTYLLFTRQKL